MTLPSIGTLWVGKALTWLEQLCLQSFLDNGHEVHLYAYDDVQNVPDGVQIADASEILPAQKIIRHARTGSPAYHADLFRLHMLRQTDHIWADTDAYCCQPWKIARGRHFHGWISDDVEQVNNGVLRLPKTSKTLKAMLEFTKDEYPIPPWLPERKRAELESARDEGRAVHVSLMPWGVWGPDALTWFLSQTGEIEHARPGHVLYPVPFSIAGVMLNPRRRRKAERLLKEDTLSIHFWGRRFRNIAAKYGGAPPEGSYVAELVRKHGIDTRGTAHMMQHRRIVAPIEAPDLSMFDEDDLANIILQRSEIGKTGPLIRAWQDGNDAPLLEHVRSQGPAIAEQALELARREVELFAPALDKTPPKRLIDIGCGYAMADLFLYRRYGCDLVLIDIEESGARHFGFASEGSGYTSLEKARKFLIANGVPEERITLINPKLTDPSEAGGADLAISLISCGYHYPVSTYEALFRDQIEAGGAIVLDIRKGSGGIPEMKAHGELEILDRQPKHSKILVRKNG